MYARAPGRLGLALAICLAAPAVSATVDPFAAAPPAQPERDAAQDPPRAEPPVPDRPVPERPAPEPAAPETPARTGSPATPAEPAPAVATAPAPTPAGPGPGGSTEIRECTLSLDAAPLLREADSRGIQPRMTAAPACDASPADNRFFGGGGSTACKLRFDNATWLRKGARFTSITGVGTFEVAPVSASGVEVSIPPQGGVRFRKIGVRLTVAANTNCPAAQPANVLAQ